MLNDNKKELISIEVISTLVTKFGNFPLDTLQSRNAPFHEAFLNAFADRLSEHVTDVPYFINLSSWLHGLNTSLGQSFFENVAHILSNGEKRTFNNMWITEQQKFNISEIITDLKANRRTPNFTSENELLYNFEGENLVNSLNFTADNYVEENNLIEAIELKSVRPNSGEMRGEKEKILYGKASLKRSNPTKNVNYYIGFPFDPLSDTPTGYDKLRMMHYIIDCDKYFDPNEVLVASELWDRLSSDENTMEQLLEIINSIATTQFMNNLNFINDYRNYTDGNYRAILTEWNLFREIQIVDSMDILLEISLTNSNIQRILNKQLFKNDNKYNEKRANDLIDILNSFRHN